ncbi:hypothetical protein GGI24_003873 [Coemansia furcata]|nr:hypothetical protein GGI24_003873 [Coemansia furcata]
MDDYGVWSVLLYTILDEKNLLDMVEKGTWVTTSKGKADCNKVSVTLEEQSHSLRNNWIAHSMIIMYLDPTLQKKYVDINDACKLWNKLKSNFMCTTTASVSTMMFEIINTRYEGNCQKLIMDYVLVKRCLFQLKLSTKDLFNLLVVNRLLQEMHYKFQDLINEKAPGIPFDLDLIIEHCKEHEIIKSNNADDEATAYAAKMSTHKMKMSGLEKTGLTCDYCNRIGHSANHCWKTPSSLSFKGNSSKNGGNLEKGNDKDHIDRQAANLLNEVALRAVTKRAPNSDFYKFDLDSGTMRHIISNADMVKITGKLMVTGFSMASSRELQCTDVGTM